MKIKDNVLIKLENEDVENGTFVIPDSITEIGICAFESCTNLKSIDISDNITVIRDCAFKKCKNLESIKISKNIQHIGVGAFLHCGKLIKKGKYTICEIIRVEDKIRYFCGHQEYEIGKQMPVIDDKKGCNIGYTYFENLYNIFNYYAWDLKDIALFEVETGDIVEKDKYDSLYVTNTIKLIRRIPWSEAFEENK